MRSITFIVGLFIVAHPLTAHADAKQCVELNNAGAESRGASKLLEAQQRYQACTAEPECPAIVRDECIAALSELAQGIPSVEVTIVDGSGHPVPGAVLMVDGTVRATGTLALDPGQHTLAASLSDKYVSQELTLSEGERGRSVRLVLPSATSSAPAPLSPAAMADSPDASRRGPRLTSPVLGLGALSVLGAGSFALFAIKGNSGMDELRACKPTCEPQEVRSVRMYYLAADISLGISIASLAAATYLAFRPAPRAAAATESRWSLQLSANDGGASAALSVLH